MRYHLIVALGQNGRGNKISREVADVLTPLAADVELVAPLVGDQGAVEGGHAVYYLVVGEQHLIIATSCQEGCTTAVRVGRTLTLDARLVKKSRQILWSHD